MIRLERFSVDLRLDGQRCPSRQMRGSMVGPGGDRRAAVICHSASAHTGVDCCGFSMDSYPGNMGFGHSGSHQSTQQLQNQRKPWKFGSNLCVFRLDPMQPLSLKIWIVKVFAGQEENLCQKQGFGKKPKQLVKTEPGFIFAAVFPVGRRVN